MKQSRNATILKMFVDFCEANPDLRFWQALRTFCGANYLIVAKDINHMTDEIEQWEDTFHWEGINK